jgi:hypothetical protein
MIRCCCGWPRLHLLGAPDTSLTACSAVTARLVAPLDLCSVTDLRLYNGRSEYRADDEIAPTDAAELHVTNHESRAALGIERFSKVLIANVATEVLALDFARITTLR